MSNAKGYCLFDEAGVIHFPARPDDPVGVVACGKNFQGGPGFMRPPERLSICFECYKYHHGKEPKKYDTI